MAPPVYVLARRRKGRAAHPGPCPGQAAVYLEFTIMEQIRLSPRFLASWGNVAIAIYEGIR